MPAPPIRYARTSDGVNIAYVDTGEGHPLVHVVCPPFTHVQAAWDFFHYQPLADRFRYIRYDARGCGLSDRGTFDYSIPAMLRDLEAVLDKTQVERFTAYVSGHGTPIALTAAAEWPERVTHIAVADGWASYNSHERPPADALARAVRDVDWTLHTETLANVIVGFSGEDARQLAAFVRAACDQDTYIRAIDQSYRYDVRDLLPRVETPVLVISTTPVRPFIPPQAGAVLAAALPNARLVMSDDSTTRPDLLEDFIYGTPNAQARARPPDGHEAALSRRERQVLALVAAGKTDAQIAEALTIASATASRHVHNILGKLGMSRRSEAAAWWASNGNGHSHDGGAR